MKRNFGNESKISNGVLTVDKAPIEALVKEDARIKNVTLDIAKPGDKTRITPVKDVIEPRVKVEGDGEVMAMVEKYGLDGINVDFEDLRVSCGQPFIQFIRELSVRCRKQGVVLSVDNYVPVGNTDYYNRAEQGVYADYVVIMGYDEHYKGSETAGSVASISYVESGIIKTVEEVPASKVINGVPFYTRLWETTGTDVDSQAVGMEMANQWVSDHGIELSWDQGTCQNYGSYEKDGTIHEVWMEDAESIKVKLSVMDANNLAGVASWCLGFETPDIWDVISEYLYK